MTKQLYLEVTVSAQVNIPKHIVLLSVEENEIAKNKEGSSPGQYYIKWSTLHYVDAEGTWQEYELDIDFEGSGDYKYPKVAEEEDDESDEEI